MGCLITACGIKPIGQWQWLFKAFWLYGAVAERKDDRPFLLIYAAPSWEDVTYRDELEALKKSLDLTIVYVLRRAHDDWEGETGYVDRELLEKHIPLHRGSRHYFVCAAPVMMDAVERALFELEVPVTNVHMEHFDLA